MDEQDIRGHTKNILDAYRSLTGIDVIPSIKEFLQVRSAAIAELSSRKTDRENKTTLRRQAQEHMPVKTKKPASERAGGGNPPSGGCPSPAVAHGQPAEPSGSGERQKSEFDILRSMKDSWN
jgi:hypothetical protein